MVHSTVWACPRKGEDRVENREENKENIVKAYIKVTGGQYEWKLEYKGHACQGTGGHGGDRKVAAIKALRDMLKRMVRPSVIDLTMNEMNVANYINQGWLGKWKENGWKGVKGTEIKHADLWQQVPFGPHAIRARYQRDMVIPDGQ